MQFKKGMIIVTLDGKVTVSQVEKGSTPQRIVRFGDAGLDVRQTRGRRFQRGLVVLPREKSWQA